MKYFLAISFVFAFFLSTAAPYKKMQDSTFITDKKVDYTSTIDKEFVYVKVATRDHNTAVSILRNGLTVYYDVKGREIKKVSVQYPHNNKELSQRSRESRERNRGENNENAPETENIEEREKRQLIRLNEMIENLPQTGLFTHYKTAITFHQELNAEGISVSYRMNNDILEYQLKIPRNQIASTDTDFSKLSIGVATTPRKRSEKSERPEDATRMKGGNQRGGGSGGRGGGGRGGNRGGQSQQKERGGNLNEDPVNIDFWFTINE